MQWLGFVPPVMQQTLRMRAEYEEYLNHCRALGMTDEIARGIILGVSHLATQIPFAVHVVDEARRAATFAVMEQSTEQT